VLSRDVLNVTVWGEGKRVVLVHGSFGWGTETWAKQRPLADEYQLVLVDRRGFGGSPPNGRVDFERDAGDVAELLEDGAHLVGQSYGGVVSLLAAAQRPEAVRSLVVIEPPAFGLVRGDPAVEQVVAGIEGAAREAQDPGDYRLRFLRGIGFDPEPVQLTGPGLEAARSSWQERPPWEAEIPLEKLRGIRMLVVRGDWSTAVPRARQRAGGAFHAVCDVLEETLGAELAVFPAAHNPQLLGAPFNERLRAFWEAT
jgi:pimeloyl-ACP methyl ester carboxylesterase